MAKKNRTPGVFQRGETWSFKIRVVDPKTGKRTKQVVRGGFRTAEEAATEMYQERANVGRGKRPSSALPLSEYLQQWLDAQSSQLKPATLDNYRRKVEAYIVPAVGAAPLKDLSALMLNAFYSDLHASGGHDGKPLSLLTVRHTHAVLRKALGDAAKTDLVEVNVALKATLPKRRPDDSPAVEHREAILAWDASQVRRFVEAVKDDRLAGAYVVAVNNGLRRGEVLGLRWSDVDLDEGRLTIRHTLGVVNNRLVFGTPKTAKSARSFRVDPVTIEALTAQRERQKFDARRWEGWANPRDLVFTREDGSPVHPTLLTREFRRASNAAGLPPIRFHDLRHTYATLALQAGVPIKVVSTRLGHANVGITWDLYSHVLPEMDDQAADTFHRFVYGG